MRFRAIAIRPKLAGSTTPRKQHRGNRMRRFAPSLVIGAMIAIAGNLIAGNPAAASTTEAPDRIAATPASQCRYATYGDLMRWGEATGRQQDGADRDWQAQLAACGVHALPETLAHAFHHSRTMGRYGRYQYDVHPVFGMATNSHRALPPPAAIVPAAITPEAASGAASGPASNDDAAAAAACGEAWLRLAANRRWRDDHAHLPATDTAVIAVQRWSEATHGFIARHCR